ncbi:MAG: hypothetical protein WAT71_04810 [Ignavibacteria bacterium]
MEVFKTKTKIKKDHKIEIENLPFENGEEVEVQITSPLKEEKKEYKLRGTLLQYENPFDSVSEDDWEVLK